MFFQTRGSHRRGSSCIVLNNIKGSGAQNEPFREQFSYPPCGVVVTGHLGHDAVEAKFPEIGTTSDGIKYLNGLLLPIRSSRHSGNNVVWLRSAPATKRLILLLSKQSDDQTTRGFSHSQVQKRSFGGDTFDSPPKFGRCSAPRHSSEGPLLLAYKRSVYERRLNSSVPHPSLNEGG